MAQTAQQKTSNADRYMRQTDESVKLTCEIVKLNEKEKDATSHPLRQLAVTFPKDFEQGRKDALSLVLYSFLWNAACLVKAEAAVVDAKLLAQRQGALEKNATVEKFDLPNGSWRFDGTVFSCEVEGCSLIEEADGPKVVAPATIMKYIEMQLKGQDFHSDPTVFAWHSPAKPRKELLAACSENFIPVEKAVLAINPRDKFGNVLLTFKPSKPLQKIWVEPKGKKTNPLISGFARLVLGKNLGDKNLEQNIKALETGVQKVAKARAAVSELCDPHKDTYMAHLYARKKALESTLVRWENRRTGFLSVFAPGAVQGCRESIARVNTSIESVQKAQRSAMSGKVEVVWSRKLSSSRFLHFLKSLFMSKERKWEAGFLKELQKKAVQVKNCQGELEEARPLTGPVAPLERMSQARTSIS